MTCVVLKMGVAGSGKTTIRQLLAAQTGWVYLDADDFHPPANVAKMGTGLPRNYSNWRSWLAAMGAELHHLVNAGQSSVLACSAL